MALRGDEPIEEQDEDLLGRDQNAESFAQVVVRLDASRGVVVGVLGPWGAGKTSFINLAKRRWASEDLTVLDFNPWMFSGAEQLVDSFFLEVSAQLRHSSSAALVNVGRLLQDYGESLSGLGWLPVVGPWIERGRLVSKSAGKILAPRQESVGERRKALAKSLSKLDAPMIVVLDDIDRLSTSEIRDVFRLIRLTASFPNIVYVVAFDRVRVERALSESAVPGREYLEKIVQLAVDLPAVPAEVLNRQILEAIGEAIEPVPNVGEFDRGAWTDVFLEIVRPLIRTMRDVRRYAIAIQASLWELDGLVQTVDVLGIEAIRVFLPDAFALISSDSQSLTEVSGAGFGGGDTRHAPRIAALRESAGSHADVVTAMINRLFPAAARHVGGPNYGADWSPKWLSGRRIAHPIILNYYLERTVSTPFSIALSAEGALSVMEDPEALQSFFDRIDPDRREDVIAALENYQDEFRPEHAVPGCSVLLNELDRLPERPSGFFDLGPRMVVSRVVLRLLRAVGSESAVKLAVDEILSNLASLSAKFELVDLVGHKEGRGHRLVSEIDAEGLSRQWRDEVRAASSEVLIREPELFRIILAVRRDSVEPEPQIALNESDDFVVSLLRSATTEVKTMSSGSSALFRSMRLPWEALEDFYGGALIARLVADLASQFPDDTTLQLAERYASGWRPDDD